MLSHSPGVRSASERGCVTPEQLRRNFFRSFFSRRFLRRPRTFAGKRNSPLERRAFVDFGLGKELERAKGLEPSTPTLARSCSTTELHPHPGLTAIARRQRQSYAKCGLRMQQPARAGSPATITALKQGNAFKWREIAESTAQSAVITALKLFPDCKSRLQGPIRAGKW